MNNRNNHLVIALAVLAAGLASWLMSQYGPSKSDESEDGQRTAVLTDHVNRRVKIPIPVKRVVTGHTAFSDMLQLIGAEKVIVGATNDTAQKLQVRSIGTHKKPDIEAILACRPDLVILSSRSCPKKFIQRTEKRLAGTGGKLVAVYPDTVDGTLKQLLTLGSLTDHRKKAAELVHKQQKIIRDIRRQVRGIPRQKRPKVFVEVSPAPSLRTCGRDSIIFDIVKRAGGVPLFQKSGVDVPIKPETVLSHQPDAYIQQIGVTNDNPTPPSKQDRLSELDCVRRGRVMRIREKMFGQPGTQVVKAVRRVHSFLYNQDEAAD